MIVVIADDLTGAAELGGLGLRYNLITEITNRIDPASKADMLVISTDTRSLSREAAELVTEQICKDLHGLKPATMFKKIDSVLRGHVLAEIRVQKRMLNRKRVLIVAGNPRLGRTVVDGIYLLNGSPVHLSSFSKDPEFPITSSSVPEMLHVEKADISILKSHELLPETGIIVGEVKDAADLAAWCKKIDADMLIAGASEFFTALLKHLNVKEVRQPGTYAYSFREGTVQHSAEADGATTAVLQSPALMICGSTFQKSHLFIDKMRRAGIPVSYMPREVVSDLSGNKPVFDKWIDEVVHYISQSGKAIIAIDPAIKAIAIDAPGLRASMAEATALLVSRSQVKECLIEGGSTSAAVLRKLGIETLYPLQELAPGVIRMSVKGREDLHITVKPGSYDWPSFMLHGF